MADSDSVPPVLYKYRSLGTDSERDRVRKTFETNSVYFPSPNQFNDPFDGAVPLSLEGTEVEWRKYILKNLKKHMPNLSPAKRLQKASRIIRSGAVEKLDPAISTRAVKHAGVYCLSAVNDDILMWAHYADSHKGICLGFRAGPMDTFFRRSQKVKYSEQYPVTRVFDSDEQRMETAILTKSGHWEYEQEYRIIEPKGSGEYSYPEGLLVSVILGCSISEQNESDVKSWVQARKQTPTLLRATKRSREYGLHVETL